jgi:eukaryotic-like serine/threonine-protein kinase
LDPNFAMAYAHLASTYGNWGRDELADENFRKAYSLRQRVADRERLHIESRYYLSRGEVERAAQVLELMKTLYPQDNRSFVGLTVIYGRLGQYDKAVAEAQEAFRKDPTQLTRWNLLNNYVRLYKLEEAKKVLAEAEAHQLNSQQLDFGVFSYSIAFLSHDPAEMERIVRSAPSGSGLEADLLGEQSYTESYYGHVQRARVFLHRAVEVERGKERDGEASFELVGAALWEATFGNTIEARRDAAEGLSLARHKDALAKASLAYARLGDLHQARVLVDELARKYPTDALLNLRDLPMTHAAIAISQNNPSLAIELLENAKSAEFGDLEVVYTRGQAYLLMHRGSEAAAEFRKILDHPGLVLYDPLGALAHLGMARAHALQGNTAQAITGYQDFLTLWKDADPDIPILKQAKAEYAKLQ